MTLKEIALQLRKASETKESCPPIRQYLEEKDLAAAYKIQQINIQHRVENGAVQVGKKIGLTSEQVQEQLGVDQPDFGILLNTMQIPNGGSLAYSELMQPKAEAEIAFVLKEDLSEGEIDLSRLKNAIDYAVAAIEIVGSRIENWDIQITDTIADNASASHFVLGNQRMPIDQLDLVNCQMQLRINDRILSEGSGKACLGNPLNAALWLAQKMQSLGNPLRKGEVLLSGALGPMAVLEPDDQVVAEIEGLGSVGFSVSE